VEGRKGKERKGKDRKGKEKKGNTFRRHFDEKPSTLSGCPGTMSGAGDFPDQLSAAATHHPAMGLDQLSTPADCQPVMQRS